MSIDRGRIASTPEDSMMKFAKMLKSTATARKSAWRNWNSGRPSLSLNQDHSSSFPSPHPMGRGQGEGRLSCSIALLFLCFLATSLQADDWPQWMGSRRDGVWRETGILRSFPSNV